MAAKKEVGVTNVYEETKRILDAEEKVKVFLHEEEFRVKTKELNINGVMLRVPVGEWTEVPKSVAALLEDRVEIIKKSKKEVEAFKTGLGKDLSGKVSI